MKYVFFIFLTIITSSSALSVSLDNFAERYDMHKEYTVWLQNGDILSGKILEIIEDTPKETGIKMQTLVGIVTIYDYEINKIVLTENIPPSNNRVFIMPTANPIGSNHFAGLYEVLFLYAGIGITDWVSITGGHSFIPKTEPHDQLSVLNAKVSSPKIYMKEDKSTHLRFAAGMNFAWLNNNNRLTHIFGIGTYNMESNSHVSFGMFYKSGNQEIPFPVYVLDTSFVVDYSDGAFGISAGADVKFSNRKDLSFIGEIWNSDVTNPTNTAFLLGLRLSGRNFSSDFGLFISTAPYWIPFISFVWTFN